MFSSLPAYEESYTSALLDKYDRLKSIEGPRVVLIGNSNLAFGIDSELLEKEIGMPVVNMGLHAGLGNEFHEQMALMDLHEDDLIVVCHTEYTMKPEQEKNYQLTWITIEGNSDFFNLVDRDDGFSLAEAFPAYLRQSFLHKLKADAYSFPYSRESFNEYGDIKEHHNGEYKFTDEERARVPGFIDDETAARLNTLNDEIVDRGANMVVCGFPIGSSTEESSSEYIDEFMRQLKNKLEMPIISDFKDYVFDESLFYDGIPHLTTEGAKLRTLQLVDDLKQYFEETAQSDSF